jgi:hypothetical protein
VQPPVAALFIALGSDGNVWFDDASGSVGADLFYVLTTSPASIVLKGPAKAQKLLAGEPGYTGSFTAISADTSVATVSANGKGFTVEAVGAGSTSINVSDSMGNAVNVPVTVNGS